MWFGWQAGLGWYGLTGCWGASRPNGVLGGIKA